MSVEEKKAQILRLCTGKFLTTGQLSEKLGLSVNTVRAYYVYPLVKEGKLSKKLPQARVKGQSYTTA